MGMSTEPNNQRDSLLGAHATRELRPRANQARGPRALPGYDLAQIRHAGRVRSQDKSDFNHTRVGVIAFVHGFKQLE